MGLTLKEELRRTFELATLWQEAQTLRTSRHWRQINDVVERARVLREREDRLHAERYDARVEIARRRLVDKAATPTRSFQPNWAPLDRFNAADLLRQAQREVRAHHDKRIDRIREAAARALKDVVQRAERENALKGSVVVAFRRAADPPHDSGPSRPSGPRRD